MMVNLVYIMSRIYTEQHSKHEFITCIKNKINTKSELVFIKKYHNYKPSLDFLPDVLSDIIMSYINDIFVVNYEINIYTHVISVFIPIKINYNYGILDEDLHIFFCNGIMNPSTLTSVTLNKWNSYMKYYHKRDQYLPYAQFDNIPYLTSYHRATKHVIIIVKKILDIGKKMKTQ